MGSQYSSIQQLLCSCWFKKKRDREVVDYDTAGKSINLAEHEINQGPFDASSDFEQQRRSMNYESSGYKHERWATFGAGCYWGTEKYFVDYFSKLGKDDALLGYAVGFMSHDENAPENPTYREVCSGSTGHVEVMHIRFDQQKVKYEDLVRHFFTFHDPTTLNQ